MALNIDEQKLKQLLELENVAGGTYGDRTLGMTSKIDESAQGMMSAYGGTDFMKNPDFIRDFDIFKKAYPGQEETLMSMLQGSGKTIYSPPGHSGIINQSRTQLDLPFGRPKERFAQITPIERKGLTELTPTNPIDMTPKFVKEELTNIPAENPGLFGIKNLFKGQSKLNQLLQPGQEAVSKLTDVQKLGTSALASAIKPEEWLSDNDDTTVGAGEVAGRALQFVKGIGTAATGLDPMGWLEAIKAPTMLAADLMKRKVSRKLAVNESLADLYLKEQQRLNTRTEDIASADELSRLRSEEKWGFTPFGHSGIVNQDVNTPYSPLGHSGIVADKGARVSSKYLSDDYKQFLKTSFDKGGVQKRPEHLKYTHKLDKGGRAFGPSHEKGGIPGFTKSGNMVEFEGDEMIFSTKDSKNIEKLKDSGNFMELGKFISNAMDKWPGGYK